MTRDVTEDEGDQVVVEDQDVVEVAGNGLGPGARRQVAAGHAQVRDVGAGLLDGDAADVQVKQRGQAGPDDRTAHSWGGRVVMQAPRRGRGMRR